MSFVTQVRGSRGGMLLVAFLASLAPASRAVADMPTTPGKLGAMTPSLCLLVAGTWFAFKEGGWISKVFAVGVLSLFGYGVSTGMEHAQSSHEVSSELAQMRANVADDMSNGDVSTEAAKRRQDAASAAAAHMQASTNPETVDVGKAMEVVDTSTREMSHTLLEALEPVQSSRFMNVAQMIEREDFEWQRKTAGDYLAGAKAAAIANETIVSTISARLRESGVDPERAYEVVKGMQRIQPLNARAVQAHIRLAVACNKLIDFVEQHGTEIEPLDDGGVRVSAHATLDAYNVLHKECVAARAALDSANGQVMQMMRTLGG